ncbi:MAG: insulinase family protein [Gemmataceae bacterium]|nr:insulinase family protein [Gemmataceae bacterium]
MLSPILCNESEARTSTAKACRSATYLVASHAITLHKSNHAERGGYYDNPMDFHRHTLPNGLTLIGETSPSARSVALGFFVKTGSRDETPDVSGVSHFLEHMVFKGTPRRSAFDVNIDFDRIGANYNAFTSEENTVFYACVLPEYLPRAADILADILRPSLRAEDFDMEKNVIIEEIGMYDDRPMWATYDKSRKGYFGDHPLGNSILGTADSIRQLARERMHDYFNRRYVAPNITVTVAGNFAWPDAVALIEKLCGEWPKGDCARQNIRPTTGNRAFQVIAKEKVAQEHVIIVSPAPAAADRLRHAADTLAMVLGDDSNSRLFWTLVDPGRADSADLSYQDNDGNGAFFTSFTCDPENAKENLGLVLDLFAKVQMESITQAELDTAKSKILSRIVRASERPMGRMQALGMAWTYLGQYRSVDDELRSFDAVSLADIRSLLDQYSFADRAVVALGPLAEM